MSYRFTRIAWVIVAVALVAVGVGGWWYLNRSNEFRIIAAPDGTLVAFGGANVKHISGVVPFSVVFVFQPYGPGEDERSSRPIDFGDGSSGQMTTSDPSGYGCGPTADCPPADHYASHTYSIPGTYTAILWEGDMKRGTVVVTVK